MRNMGPGTCDSACGRPYGMDVMNLAAVLQAGEKRKSHPSIVVPGPAAPKESSGLCRGSPSGGHPLCKVPPGDPTVSCGPGWPIGTWQQCSHTLLGHLCSVPKASQARKPPHRRKTRPGLLLTWRFMQIPSPNALLIA